VVVGTAVAAAFMAGAVFTVAASAAAVSVVAASVVQALVSTVEDIRIMPMAATTTADVISSVNPCERLTV
jgi:hypothetical protein